MARQERNRCPIYVTWFPVIKIWMVKDNKLISGVTLRNIEREWRATLCLQKTVILRITLICQSTCFNIFFYQKVLFLFFGHFYVIA